VTGSLIRPFPGYVPRADIIEEVVAPPVSSITTARYQQLVADNPASILHILGSAIDTGEGGADTSLFDRLGAVRLRAMVDDGILEPHREAFYVLTITVGPTTHTGIVCEVNTSGVDDGRIKRHEHTRAETEELVVDHLDIVGAHTDPVTMTFRPQPDFAESLAEIVADREPLRRFTADDGSEQRLWAVDDDSALPRLAERLDQIPALYITDGHHRTAAAARLRRRRSAANEGHAGCEPYNYLLTVLFAADELIIHGFNRAVTDLGGLNTATLLQRVAEVADVDEIAVAWAEEAQPRSPGTITMLLGGHWYRLRFREEDIPDDARGSLDAVLLQDLVLGPVLGITDPRSDHRLHYIPGPAGLAELEHSGAAVAFALHAASVTDVMAVADQGEVMPPKSTWFVPKVMTGLVVRMI